MMVLIGALMLRRRRGAGGVLLPVTGWTAAKVVSIGLCVGLLSGFFGIGGGFLRLQVRLGERDLCDLGDPGRYRDSVASACGAPLAFLLNLPSFEGGFPLPGWGWKWYLNALQFANFSLPQPALLVRAVRSAPRVSGAERQAQSQSRCACGSSR
jgi:hypothetical protein